MKSEQILNKTLNGDDMSVYCLICWLFTSAPRMIKLYSIQTPTEQAIEINIHS